MGKQVTSYGSSTDIRWTSWDSVKLEGFGELRTTYGETILYSGAEEHHRGVGLILTKSGRQSLIEWNPVNDRIISARFFSRFIRTTIIQIYSPTNEQLQREIAKVPKHDILLIMGDENAKVGTENEGWERVMGRE